MSLSGSVETKAYEFSKGTRTVILQWTAEQDYPSGETTLSWEAVGGGTYTQNPVVCELRVTIDGDVEFYKEPISSNRVNCYIGTVLASGTKVIKHNADGTRNVVMKIEAGISEWAINRSGEKTFVLNPIPKASEIGATDANIGSKSSIVVTKKTPDYMHSIKYEFGSLSGYINSNGEVSSVESKFSATSVAFTVPNSFYAQIPNAKTGTCKLTCTTYSGNTKIGGPKTTEFTVTAAEALCAPSVSGTIVDNNAVTVALTGDSSKLVRYFSTALCTIGASAKNGASLKTKKIGGIVVSANTRTIPEIETGSVTFYAQDSRGYETAVTVKKSLINYVKLTVNAQLNRVDPTSGNAILAVKGNYFNNSFGVTNNSLKAWYRIAKTGESYGNWIQVSPTLGDNSYQLQVNLSGLDYQYSYSAQVRCDDELISKTVTTTVSQGIPVVDWGEKDFRFNVPFLVPDSAKGTTLPSIGRKGQVFFLKNSDGSYSIRIHDGTSW